MNEKIAILYRRFSDTAQSKGDSLRRQSKYATEWCEKNNARIVDVHTDAGVSGFKGKHAAIGALGMVLTAIEKGEIPVGAYLLVENLDRLGREEIASALDRFTSILRHGVKIVTLMDGKVFTEESCNNVGDLMWAIMTMARANEESATKSKRAKESWQGKLEQIKNGLRPKMVVPSWFDYDERERQYTLNEKAEAVRLAFDYYLSGLSIYATVKELNDKKIKSLRKTDNWSFSSLQWVLKHPATYGALEIENELIEDFFPAAISKDLYFQVQAELKRRGKRTGTTRQKVVSNLLTGLATCEVCGAPMHLQGTFKKLSSGGMADYRYLMCSTNRHGHCESPNFKYSKVEYVLTVILGMLSTLPQSEADKDKRGILKGRLDALEMQRETVRTQIENLVRSMADFYSDTVAKRIPLLEAQERELDEEILETKGKLADIELESDSEALQAKMKKLAANITDTDYRVQIVAMLNRVVDKWVFNADGSCDIDISSNRIHIDGFKKVTTITMPNKKITVKAK